MSNLPCPWGPAAIDLRNKNLSTNEKLWLITNVINKKILPKDIEEKYNISTKKTNC